MRKAFNDAAKRLRAGWKVSAEEHFSQERQRARVVSRWEKVSAPARLQDSEVKVWYPNGAVHFTWKAPSGTVNRFRISGSKAWLPTPSTEAKRYISFTKDGMSLLDETKNIMLFPRKADKSAVTWPKADIARLPQSADLIECWKFHLPAEIWDVEAATVDTLTAPPMPPQAPQTRPAHSGTDDFVPAPLKLNQDSSGYSKPPSPDEGTWIVNEFLNHFLDDDGGRLFIGKMANFPERSSEHVRIQLKDFLSRPEYTDYRWRQDWEEILNNENQGTTNKIRANLLFCRDILRTDLFRKKAQGKNTTHSGSWWIIAGRKEGW